ncbi:MAG TPA: hypothetical protein VM369_03870 [Candidatus Binatia bacterium]|nr:hypothetical protein [Candidatus Binatia bacterium]
MIAKRRHRKRREPLDVELTVVMKFGDSPRESVTLLRERRMPLVGSVFENRDRIARAFLRLLVRSGRRPEVLKHLLPRRRTR